MSGLRSLVPWCLSCTSHVYMWVYNNTIIILRNMPSEMHFCKHNPACGIHIHVYISSCNLSLPQWGYFSNTLVYAFRKPDKVEHCVIFWNTSSGDKYAKTVKNLVSISSCKDFCLLVTKLNDGSGQVRVVVCFLLAVN